LHATKESVFRQVNQWKRELEITRQKIEAVAAMEEIQGATGDKVKSYMKEIHLPLLLAFQSLLSEYQTKLRIYQQEYDKIDSHAGAKLSQDRFEEQMSSILERLNLFQTIDDRVGNGVGMVAGIVSVSKPSGVEIENNCQRLRNKVIKLNTKVGEHEYQHQSMDFILIEEMLANLKAIINRQSQTSNVKITAYQAGSMSQLPEYQKVQKAAENYRATLLKRWMNGEFIEVVADDTKCVDDIAEGTGNVDTIDLFKLKPEDVTREIAEWLIANPVNVFATQHPYLTQFLTGVDVSGLFYAGGFVMDDDGVYHARQEWSLQSFEYSGYNDFYDTVFHYATSMAKEKFEFNSDGEDYILWAWKGDYLNLGAGAEMGIYTRMEVLGAQTDHWLVDQSLAMPMTLALDYNGKQIISYDPKKVDPQIFDPLRKSTDKWWVTGFNPDYQDVKASELTTTYTVTFNTQAMYDDFYDKYGQGRDKDIRWTFDPKTITAKFEF
jgi:hypothetical protein